MKYVETHAPMPLVLIAAETKRMSPQDFYAEQCTLASLSHPNVVAFYGVVEESDGGCPGTVQEYLAGGSLKKALARIRQRGAKSGKGGDGDAPRVKLALDVARGVEYLHWRRVIHFDIKADNILTDVRDPKCVLGLHPHLPLPPAAGPCACVCPTARRDFLPGVNSQDRTNCELGCFGFSALLHPGRL